jgi:hypothetical protein
MKMRRALFLCPPHVASGLFVFRDALMLVVHPTHVVRIEPLAHTYPPAAVFRVLASIPTAQYGSYDYQDRKAHHKTDHRLSHGRLLNTPQLPFILGHAF